MAVEHPWFLRTVRCIEKKCVDERRPESVDNAADISVVASPWQRPIEEERLELPLSANEALKEKRTWAISIFLYEQLSHSSVCL